MNAVRNGILLGLLLAGPLAAQQGGTSPSGLLLQSVRLFRGDGQTRVKAFVEVPHRLLTRAPDGKLYYRMDVTVRDTADQVLMQDGWSQATVPLDEVASAAGLEILEFAVLPGRYQVVVSMRDSLSGTVYRDSTSLTGYAEPPLASDLVVSRSIRAAKPEDSLPRGGEWRHGNLVITASPYLRLPVQKPELYYVLEVYSSRPDSASISAEVLNDSGRVMIQSRPRRLPVEGGGSVLTGGMNLAGVPQGEYRLRLALTLGDSQTTREAPFAVRALETPVAQAEEQNPDAAFFGAMGEAQLDSAQAPLMYIAQPAELAAYSRGLSVPAKQRFLAEFWQRRDANRNDGVNPNREAFYSRIDQADRLYREGSRSKVQGWRTDRGRIFLKYGTADEIFRRPEEGQTPPLEVWRYTSGKARYFIFADRSRIGTFLLLHSNEVTEPGRPDWQETMGFYGIEAVERFLGVNLGLRDRTPR